MPEQPSTCWCAPHCVPPESSSALTNLEGKSSFAAMNSRVGYVTRSNCSCPSSLLILLFRWKEPQPLKRISSGQFDLFS